MLARAHTFTIDGLRARHVTVEVDARPGLPAFVIIGLADTAVREARERVRSAILNSGFEFPARRIIASLAPADVPKAGPGLDLALACGVLAATGQLPAGRLASHALLGELALDGAVRASRGTLAIADAARRAGLQTLALAGARAREATLVEGLDVAVVERLESAVRVLTGGPGDPMPPSAADGGEGDPASAGEPDLSDISGQHHAVRSLVIAAAGGHNLLLSGAPGTGKTMLARRAPSILPPLSPSEAIEVARVASLLGSRVEGLALSRPFRAPHHSITGAGLLGGGREGCVGEAVLAHNGILFLDELSEFARPTLEALRQPLEEGRVAIARARHSAVYPARFMLLAATNPCPCGYAAEADRCSCAEADRARHRRRFSGPLIDRIDLLAGMSRAACDARRGAPLTSTERARAEVAQARERQSARLREEAISVNAHMDVGMVKRHVRLDDRGASLLHSARQQGMLSYRGEHRALRVARTIADLAGAERVRAEHVGAALALRPEAVLAGEADR